MRHLLESAVPLDEAVGGGMQIAAQIGLWRAVRTAGLWSSKSTGFAPECSSYGPAWGRNLSVSMIRYAAG
jgi:hypothetical protein